MKSCEEDYSVRLAALSREHRLRSLPADRKVSGECIDLSSNDYLGLATGDDSSVSSFLKECASLQFSSSASRLLSHSQDCHKRLEDYLATLYDKPVLLFNSGYHANTGIIPALGLPGTHFLADKLAHASMIDGLILSRSPFERFRHNDMENLEKLLQKNSDKRRVIVLTEGIFSMDGDEAPLETLVELKHRYPNMLLYLDEAHSFGVRGKLGLGLAEEKGLLQEVDILIGTFGKAAASCGAFVASSEPLRNWIMNSARSFIFSTALPPVNAAFTEFMVRKITAMQREREALAAISSYFRRRLVETVGAEMVSRSQIVPWIIGDSLKALSISQLLRREGFDAIAIRRPTVPPNTERIRFSLNVGLTREMLDPLFDLIAKVVEK